MKSIAWAAIALLLLGCELKAGRYWVEEVELSDGTVIEISRSMIREAFGEPGHAGKVIEQNITYDSPSGKIVWPGKIDPIIFDRLGGRYYVVAVPTTMEECELYGKKDSPFVFYELHGTDWKTLEKTELPDGFKTNLLWNAWSNDQPKRITLADKRKRDSNMSRGIRNFDKSNPRPCGKYWQ